MAAPRQACSRSSSYELTSTAVCRWTGRRGPQTGSLYLWRYPIGRYHGNPKLCPLKAAHHVPCLFLQDFPNQFYRQPACLHEVLKYWHIQGLNTSDDYYISSNCLCFYLLFICVRVCVFSRRFVRTGRTALVFIVSDSLSGDGSSRLLFPKDLLEELSICSIRSYTRTHTVNSRGGHLLIPHNVNRFLGSLID